MLGDIKRGSGNSQGEKIISGLLARDAPPQCGGLTISNKQNRHKWCVISDSKPQKALQLPLCSLPWITHFGRRQLPGHEDPPTGLWRGNGSILEAAPPTPPPAAPVQAFRLLQPQGYVNIFFLLKILHINVSIHQWILFATIIVQYLSNSDGLLPSFCLHLLTAIL